MKIGSPGLLVKILAKNLKVPKGASYNFQLPTSAEVIFQNGNYAVINKPPIVLSQPPDLRSWYLHHDYDPVILFDLLRKNEGLHFLDENLQPRIIHRIDSCVSGGMVIALNKNAAKMFSKNLKLGGNSGYKLVRKYVAKVGPPSAAQNVRRGLIRMNGSLTYFKRVDDEHIVLELLTGKKHQIRKGAAVVLQTPIYNDVKYGGESMFNIPFQIALHSAYVKTKIGMQVHEHLIPVPINFGLLWGGSLNIRQMFHENVNEALMSDWSEEIKSAINHIKDTHLQDSQVYAVE